MLHCDAETLALVALGEPLSDDERAHLKVCARCQAELEQNRAIVATGRAVTPADGPTEPPPAVWEAISTELGLGDQVQPHVPDPQDAGERGRVVALAQYRKERQEGRRRSAWTAVAAAAVGIALGAVGTAVVTDDRSVPGTVLASSPLAVVPANAGGTDFTPADAAGTATIVDTDGQDYAEVDTTGLPQGDGYYEVWLIKGDLSGMMSLGALSAGAQGRFTIPAGTDLAEYTIVDVSLEPFNGDPTHSRQSVLRGSFEA